MNTRLSQQRSPAPPFFLLPSCLQLLLTREHYPTQKAFGEQQGARNRSERHGALGVQKGRGLFLMTTRATMQQSAAARQVQRKFIFSVGVSPPPHPPAASLTALEFLPQLKGKTATKASVKHKNLSFVYWWFIDATLPNTLCLQLKMNFSARWESWPGANGQTVVR